MVVLDLIVTIPGLAASMPKLNVAHPTLHQPPGDQDLPGLDRIAVHLANELGFATDIECIRGFHFHSIG